MSGFSNAGSATTCRGPTRREWFPLGRPTSMTEPDERTAHRAQDLLPEEKAAGSDDPTAQAEALLADSDERTDRREQTMRKSHQTPN